MRFIEHLGDQEREHRADQLAGPRLDQRRLPEKDKVESRPLGRIVSNPLEERRPEVRIPASNHARMRRMKRDEILRILREHRDELCREYGVKSLALFGSASRNEATERSDVDLLVEFDHPIGLLHLIGTEQHLEDLLGTKVDLVLRRAVIPELNPRIFSEAMNAF